MPDEYARAVHELVRAKVEQRAPELTVEAEGKPAPHVINIMDALKKSMQKQGEVKVRDAVRKRMGKAATSKVRGGRSAEPRTGSRRTAH